MEQQETILEKVQYLLYEVTLFRVQEVGITLNHILVAVVSIVLSLMVSRFLQTFFKKRVFQRFPIDAGLEFTLLRILHFIILGIGVLIGLSTMNIPLGALVGLFAVIGVGIGFGLQNIASNFISGLILLFERPVKVGDRIELDGIWGDVKQINLRTTVIETPDDISVIVPNSRLLENNLINNSYGNPRIRLHVPVGVAYGSDVELVTRLMKEAAKDVPDVMSSPSPDVWFLEFGDSSLNFELLVWINRAAKKFIVIDRLNRNIDALFREHDVQIPFPQRDLHVKSVHAPIRVESEGGH